MAWEDEGGLGLSHLSHAHVRQYYQPDYSHAKTERVQHFQLVLTSDIMNFDSWHNEFSLAVEITSRSLCTSRTRNNFHFKKKFSLSTTEQLIHNCSRRRGRRCKLSRSPIRKAIYSGSAWNRSFPERRDTGNEDALPRNTRQTWEEAPPRTSGHTRSHWQ